MAVDDTLQFASNYLRDDEVFLIYSRPRRAWIQWAITESWMGWDYTVNPFEARLSTDLRLAQSDIDAIFCWLSTSSGKELGARLGDVKPGDLVIHKASRQTTYMFDPDHEILPKETKIFGHEERS